MFSNWVNSVKGFLGVGELEVVPGGEQEEKIQHQNSDERQSLFKQLSQFMGKDITSMISLPIWIFEPFSFLQVMCEPMQFDQGLLKAAEHEDSAYRMAFVAAFTIGGYSCATRNKKPFNPILGETFEYIPADKRWKFFAEQVSHHPPIGVAQAFAENFTLLLEMQVKAKFSGNSSDVTVHGSNHFYTTKFNDHFSWGHLDTCAHNVIIGGMWIDHFGTLEMINHTNGDRGVFKVSKAGWLGSGRFEVNGDIFDASGNLRLKVQGKWNDAIYAFEPENLNREKTLLWKRERTPPLKWGWTKFNQELCEFDSEYQAILPPNDSRLRPDRLALEKGTESQAGKEKHKLEEEQRAKRRAREASGEVYSPKYFQSLPDERWGHKWEYVGKYWEERQQRIEATQSKEKEEVNTEDNKEVEQQK